MIVLSDSERLLRTPLSLSRCCQSEAVSGWTWVLPSSCPATIVTAYFNIKSKASHSVYLQRMQNFLSLQDCMVIFTSPDMAGWVHKPKIWRVTLCLQDNQRDPTELLSDSHRPHRPTPGMKPRRMSDLYVE